MVWNDGYQHGLTHEEISIPSKYESEEQIKQVFTIPNDVPKFYKSSFKQGFENGYKAKEDEAYQRGFNLAYKTTKYKSDEQYKKHSNLLNQHKNGFEANKEAEVLREKAFETGKNGGKRSIPDKLSTNIEAVDLYNKNYKKGKEERDGRNKQILIGSLIFVPTGIVGGYYLYKRKKKHA